MILRSVWPDVCAALAGGNEVAPARWRALFGGRSRPLLVAGDDAAAAHRALRFFYSSAPLRALGTVQLLLQRMIGMPQLPVLQHAGLVHPRLLGLSGPSLSGVAMQCGSSGPLQKLTLFSASEPGGAPLLVKMALRPSADVAIEREVHWLQRLARMPHLADCTPTLRAYGRLPSGRAFLTTDVLERGDAVHALDGPTLRMLSALGISDAVEQPWCDSPNAGRLRRRWAACQGILPHDAERTIARALDELQARLGPVVLPPILQHGDFAPWNIRQAGSRICVFDWEYAQCSCNPLADFMHFHLIPRALGAWPPSVRYIQQVLLPKSQEFAALAWPRVDASPTNAAALLLEYLMDTVLFYTESSCRFEPSHPVVKAYMGLIERRGQWGVHASH